METIIDDDDHFDQEATPANIANATAGECLRSPLLSSSSEVGIRQRGRDVSSSEQNPQRRPRRQSRLLDRNAAFFQSTGQWGVHRLSRRHRLHLCSCLGRIWEDWILGDWFHRLAYQRTLVLMGILFIIYASIVGFFAVVYLGVSVFGQAVEVNPDGTRKVIAFCDMDINDHMEALYFSLSTMTTIGYGVSDYYFGGCWTPLLLVLWQVCSAITFDAVAVGLLFHRISRGTKRGKTILFSSKAVVRRVKGVPHLMFRIAELRRYHLIEATVRCYCIRHERVPVAGAHPPATTAQIDTTHFICRQIKLLYPDENCGSHLWMGLPQVIVHRMDETSPLVPTSQKWFDAQGVAHNTDDLAGRATLERFLLDRDAEIIVLVQGVDEATGAITQARHSYKTCDLEWNHTFVNCARPCTGQNDQSAGPAVQVDFSVFHNIEPVQEDTEACPYVP